MSTTDLSHVSPKSDAILFLFLSAYTELCGDVATSTYSYPELSSGEVAEHNNAANATSLSRREADLGACVYGMPAIAEVNLRAPGTIRVTDRRLLTGFAFCIVVVLCIIQHRRK